MKIPVFVALDVDSDVEALKIAEATATYVGGFKLGPRLVLRYGVGLIEKLSPLGAIFIDNKYHDIPSTMLAAVQTSFDMGASYVTIHASAGPEALKKIGALEAELNQKRPFHIVAVTVLTSMSEKSLPSNWEASKNIAAHVESLAFDSQQGGVSGLVCSPFEVAALRQRYPNAFLLTPGVRPKDSELDDQTRVMTPVEALKRGSSALVIGRPIIAAPHPKQAAKAIFDDIQAAGVM